MDVILSGVKWQFALVYIDDIIVSSRTPNQHIDLVRQILTLLQRGQCHTKIKKV